MNQLANYQAGQGLTEDQVELIKRTIAKNSTNDELQLFVGVCNKTGLDPFTKQIYAVKRWNSKERREEMAIQVSIDGFRLVAARTGEYEGQTPPQWCGPDGVWKDVWLDNKHPVAARVGVYRKNFREPVWGIARFDAYAQTNKDGQLSPFWRKMPDLMIAKVAESLALRKAFPMELSGLYSPEEMGESEDQNKIAQSKTETKTEALKERLEVKEEPKPEPKPKKAVKKQKEEPVDAEVVEEQRGAQEEDIPDFTPPQKEEDPGAFFEQPAPELKGEENDPKSLMIKSLEQTKDVEELKNVWAFVHKMIKEEGILSEMPVEEALEFKSKLTAIKDKKKKEFAI